MIDAMNAVRVGTWGGPRVLEYEVAPRPVAGPGEVLVRVHGAGVNPVDWKVRSGEAQGMISRLGPDPFPVILGWDVAGVVEAVGSGVAGFAPGERVLGCVRFPDLGNAYAEYVAAPADHLAHVPDGLDLHTAAAVPLAALTAWQALDAIDPLEGQRVVVVGASGGVGHLAVQLAKRRGAEVVAVASTRNRRFVRELGADEAVDYTVGDVAAQVGDIDAVVDTVGPGGAVRELVGALGSRGAVVSIAGGIRVRDLPDGVRGASIMVVPSGEQLARVGELIAARRLRVAVQEVVPAVDAWRAHEIGEAGHLRGKLVIDLAG